MDLVVLYAGIFSPAAAYGDMGAGYGGVAMKSFKYVVLDDVDPVIFDAPLLHKDMRGIGNITSAGYFVRIEGAVKIVGEAISIPVKNGVRDQYLIENFFKSRELL